MTQQMAEKEMVLQKPMEGITRVKALPERACFAKGEGLPS